MRIDEKITWQGVTTSVFLDGNGEVMVKLQKDEWETDYVFNVERLSEDLISERDTGSSLSVADKFAVKKELAQGNERG